MEDPKNKKVSEPPVDEDDYVVFDAGELPKIFAEYGFKWEEDEENVEEDKDDNKQ